MQNWTDSVAFITGGARGLGLGIARALAKRGVSLALADVDAPALQRSGEELKQVTEVRTYRLDVRDRAAFAEVADEAERALGPVGLLFNNAGIAPYSAIDELSYEKWDLTLAINLTGVVNGVQTFLPRMLERRTGHIVNTASGAGLVAGPNVLYTTTKFAVVGLSESLSAAVAEHGIDVSVICPGPVATDIIANTGSLDAGVAMRDDLVPSVEAFLKSGTSIDEAGEMVVTAMEAGKPWISTGYDMRPYLEQRTAALLNSLA
ncbi:NAD(P)-dependent dehydrogenase (short-subunit alcohol dehydrogenase family) [Saccharothrix tamanrassetensis]|uniref:NAD(P)-dependent dehydrogenase (Short-subunit alcohol dehydrogenase family) n=1 Tax=Saccharothrix tamanrassetensis TaxID=1051531 RepID=A0A841CQ08_9PSEU|nr:SDR family oxidoreductase [Saccharothrix tamanrassetensis]MBB5960492.1 NAD(P)-dependent dehydrogenase (short-subunit alcohol dehydrogenase family) [Saccharothrix tamanrassetensis]